MRTHSQTENEPIVSLKGVARTFDNGVTAIAGVDLDVARGEFLTILGGSGTGKSTLLRLMAGLDEPTAGTLARAPDVARRGGTSMVFQDAALMPWASVRDNVWLPLRFAGIKRAHAAERIDAALETVGLADRADALPRELSGGMAMRVSIARALVSEPALLLLDEPFGALDEITRFRLNDVVRELWQARSLTCVLVTHSVFEAAYMSSRVVVIGGTPAAVTEQTQAPQPLVRDAAFRRSPAYLDYTRRLSEMLERSV